MRFVLSALRAVGRGYAADLGGLALAVLAVAACDLKREPPPDAAPLTATATAPATAAQPTTAPTEPTPVAPLGATSAHPGAPGAPGTAHADGGKTAPAADGGTAPAPTPTFTIPTAIPGFDAGGFKPPPGFPSTLPTFPPPQQK